MKFNKAILVVSLFIGVVTACTDKWDEHYSVAQHGEGSLWQTISNDASLSNFKKVLEAANYDAQLSSSQVFTVFAPNNTELTDEMCAKLIQQYNAEMQQGIKDKDNSVVKEFIQNHISLYNYSVSNVMPDTTIRMMNGKNISFTKEQFAGHNYISKNTAAANGIIYTIGNIADYHPNVYEALS
ncbi:MAG: fasciclin domain-containing protein, partial [Prevotella sp.]|nr:fasciclin domain-containing protein [Prevotella sp.]